jgi:subtilisin family serine protease
MSRTRVAVILALFLSASAFPAILETQAGPQGVDWMDETASKVQLDYNPVETHANQILVGFRVGFDFSAIEDFAERNELRTLRLYPAVGEAVFEISDEDRDTAMFRVAQDSSVISVSPNGFYKMSYTPNDPRWTNQWGPKKIQAQDAWNLTKGNSSIIVAILDTGVDYNHEDLSGNMWRNPSENGGTPGVDDDGNGYVDDLYGWNFANDTKYVIDNNDRDTMPL